MVNCSKCGAELIGSRKFCAACGAPADPPAPAPASSGTDPLAKTATAPPPPPRASAYGPPPAPPPQAPPPPAPTPGAYAPSPLAASSMMPQIPAPPPPPAQAPPQPAPYPPSHQGSYQPSYPQGSSAVGAAANWVAGAANAVGNAMQQPAYPPPQAAYGAYPAPPPYGAPQAYAPPAQAPYAQPSAYGPPPAAPSNAAPYGPPMPALGPGARVLVQWANGQRYPATVVQAAHGQCLVVFPDGQQQWVANHYLTPGT